jgi:hypothetical protein
MPRRPRRAIGSRVSSCRSSDSGSIQLRAGTGPPPPAPVAPSFRLSGEGRSDGVWPQWTGDARPELTRGPDGSNAERGAARSNAMRTIRSSWPRSAALKMANRLAQRRLPTPLRASRVMTSSSWRDSTALHCLLVHRQPMTGIDHPCLLGLPIRPSTPDKRSFSNVRCPILGCRTSDLVRLGVSRWHCQSDRCAFQRLDLPLRDLVRVNCELLCYRGQAMLTLPGCDRRLGLEGG